MPRKVIRARQSAHAAAKPAVDELLSLRQRLNEASTHFIKLDLDTALIFTTIAKESENPTKRDRNRKAARRAYDTMLRLMCRVSMSEQDAQIVSRGLERLKIDLKSLGETL